MGRTITITSGKGGVGKTNISLNLALYLSSQGYRICLFDADLGLSNINILLGLQPDYDLSDVILRGRNLEDTVISVREGVDILPGSVGLEEMANLQADRLQAVIESLSELNEYDFLLLDTSAGISQNVISFCLASSEVVLVTAPEPTSLTDSFALLKVLMLNGFTGEAMVVINQCKGPVVAAPVYKKFRTAAMKHLNVDVPALGVIHQDAKVAEAVKQQRPFLSLYPDSNAAKCIRHIGKRLLQAGADHVKEVDMTGFWSRCLQLISSPLKLPNSNKESDRPVSKPLLQGGKQEPQQTAAQDRPEDLPGKPADSAAIAGPLPGGPAAQSPISVSQEGEEMTHEQVPSSIPPAGTTHLERVVPLMETLVGSIPSLIKELQLVREAIARHEMS